MRKNLTNINIDIANISNSKVYPWIFHCKDRSFVQVLT